MTIAEWKLLSPAHAADKIHRRLAALRPGQQQATISALFDNSDLIARLEKSDRTQPLGGVPVLAKDIFDVTGFPTRAGSTFLPEVRKTGPVDSTFVRHVHSQGAVCVGKTQLHEFAYGITGENPHSGDCEHPSNPGRTSGGSSSGSAAAVAAGIVPLALGTDTGGSVRVPAAFCGVFGFRMQPQDRFIADAVPLAPSFDTAGWFTGTAGDMKISHAALIGTQPRPDHARGFYLAWPDVDSDVALACRTAAKRLGCDTDADTTATLTRGFAGAVDTYSTIVAREAWEFHAPWFDRFADRYDPNVRQRLETGRALPRSVYERALVELAAARLLWAKCFLAFDFIVLPATPCGALTKAECTPENRRRLLAVNAPASLGGHAALTIPLALPSGLTTGIQVIVPHPSSAVIPWALDCFA